MTISGCFGLRSNSLKVLLCFFFFFNETVKNGSFVRVHAQLCPNHGVGSSVMKLSRQEYWSGLPFPTPEDLSDPGIKPGSPSLQVDSLPSELQGNLGTMKIFYLMLITLRHVYIRQVNKQTLISGI